MLRVCRKKRDSKRTHPKDKRKMSPAIHLVRVLLYEANPHRLRTMLTGISQLEPDWVLDTADTAEKAAAWIEHNHSHNLVSYELYQCMRDAKLAGNMEVVGQVLNDIAKLKEDIRSGKETTLKKLEEIEREVIGKEKSKGLVWRMLRVELIVAGLLFVTGAAVMALIGMMVSGILKAATH